MIDFLRGNCSVAGCLNKIPLTKIHNILPFCFNVYIIIIIIII